MRNSRIVLLLMIMPLLFACSLPFLASDSGVEAGSLTNSGADSMETSPTEISDATPTAAPMRSTSTATPMPTLQPIATPTPLPVVFDHSGYKQFAIALDFFPGLAQFYERGNISEIGYAFSPTGDRMAVSACWGSMDTGNNCERSDSDLLVVLDTDSGELVTEIPTGGGCPGGVAFSADGQTLLYGTTEKIALWNLASNTAGLILHNQPATGRLRFPAVAAAPDGRSYAAVVGQNLYVWDTGGSLLLQTPAALLQLAYAPIAYSANGARMAIISTGGVGVEVYDRLSWSLVRKLEWDNLLDIALSPDGRWLAGINLESDTAAVWNLETGTRVAELEPGHQVGYIRFNPAGDLLIITGPVYEFIPDRYSRVGTLYETTQWSLVEWLYSFTDWGQVQFNQAGTRMAMMGAGSKAIYEEARPELMAGYEIVQQFQAALSASDYNLAAGFLEFFEEDGEYLEELGLQRDRPADGLAQLCADAVLFCYPTQELVVMGYDWEYLTYMVRLRNADGTFVTNNRGDQIFTFYLRSFTDGTRLVSLPHER